MVVFLNVISMNNIRFLRKSLFKKLSAFKVIHFVYNSEENKTLIFHIHCMLQKTFCVKKKHLGYTKTYLMDTSFTLYLYY